MPFCRECGKEIQRGVKFCPECGAAQTVSEAHPAVVESNTHPKEPGSVYAKSIDAIHFGFGLGFLTLAALFFSAPGVPPASFALSLVIFAGGGAVLLFSGYGILRRTAWARLSGLFAGVDLLLVGVLLIAANNAFLTLLGALSVLAGLATLAFVRMERFRSFFT